MTESLNPISPGELLNKEFLLPLGITKYRLAKEIDVPAQRIGDIVAGKRSITADTDLRFARFFGLPEGYWLRAQVDYDIRGTRDKLTDELAKIRPWQDATSKQDCTAAEERSTITASTTKAEAGKNNKSGVSKLFSVFRRKRS